MPRKKDDIASQLFPGTPTDAEITAEMEYQDFVESLGDSTVAVTIHRYPKFGNILEWCDNGTVSDATLESIREKHGPGKYRLTFRGPTGLLGTKHILIAARYEGKEIKPNGNGNGSGGMDEFMKQQLIMQQNMMLAVLGSLKGPDMGAMMSGLAAIMAAMRSPTDKPVDPIAIVNTVSQLYQGIKDKNEKSPLEQIRDVASVIKEFSSDSNGSGIESGWGAAVEIGKEALNKLSPVLTAMVPQPLQNPQVSAVSVGQPGIPPAHGALLPKPGNAVLPGTVPAVNPPDARQNLERWVQSMVAFFKPKALRGSDPGLWIDYVFESPEDPGCQALTFAIRNGATFEDLLAFDAEIAQNPQLNLWFKTVYDGIRSELLQSGMAPAGESRDESHPVPDGKPGPAGPPIPSGLPDGTVIPKPS